MSVVVTSPLMLILKLTMPEFCMRTQRNRYPWSFDILYSILSNGDIAKKYIFKKII